MYIYDSSVKFNEDVNALDVQHRMPLHYAFVKKEKQLDTSAADPVETVTSLCAVEGVQVRQL